MKFFKTEINGCPVTISFDSNSIHIFNGYSIKDDLKLRGYRFNPKEKSWYINPDNVDMELKNLTGNISEEKEQNEIGNGNEKLSDLSNEFPESYSVIELRNRLDKIIKEGLISKIWIRGVIASEVKRYKWFSYFNLKDEENENLFFNVECKNTFMENVEKKLKELKISERLEKNLPVFLGVEVKVSNRNLIDVRLSLIDIVPEFTVAKLKSEKDITLERLMKDDILYKQKKLKLPLFVENIGIISSEQGTSVRDILSGLYPYEKRYNFFFIDSRMEGENAVSSIINAIDYFERRKKIKIDLLVIARGGGSEQSLSVFNDYNLCRKVCLVNIPVLAAIGHDKDLSAIEICSFVSPVPSTPSGAGKYLAQKYFDLQTSLKEQFKKNIDFFHEFHTKEKGKLRTFLKYIPSISSSVLRVKKKEFGNLYEKFNNLSSFILRENRKLISIFSSGIYSKLNRILISEYDKIDYIWEEIKWRRESFILKNKKSIMRIIEKTDFDKINESNKRIEESIKIKVKNLISISHKKIERSEKKVEIYNHLINSLSPNEVLKKGYTLVLNKDNKIIPNLLRFKNEDFKKLKFFDGEIEIEEKEKR